MANFLANQGISYARSATGDRESRTASTAEEAFAAELIAVSEAAFRLIRATGAAPDDAADILQEAAMRAWRHRDQRRGDFGPWFLTIAYREARRPRRRWSSLRHVGSMAAGEDPSETLPADLAAVLARLPKRQRVALSLRYEADLSTASVARVMGLSETATKQLLYRGRQALRKALVSSHPSRTKADGS